MKSDTRPCGLPFKAQDYRTYGFSSISSLTPWTHIHSCAHPILLRHPFCSFSQKCGTGISTGCPSPTPLGLGLGPDLPWADEPSPGNLRFSTNKILTYFSLLMPAFSLLHRPPLLPVWLLPVQHAPLPPFQAHSFGGKF